MLTDNKDDLSLSGHFSTLADLWCIFCTRRRITSSSNHRCKMKKKKQESTQKCTQCVHNGQQLHRTLNIYMRTCVISPFSFHQTAKKTEELWEVGRL